MSIERVEGDNEQAVPEPRMVMAWRIVTEALCPDIFQ
jgi:hypothetical protein